MKQVVKKMLILGAELGVMGVLLGKKHSYCQDPGYYLLRDTIRKEEWITIRTEEDSFVCYEDIVTHEKICLPKNQFHYYEEVYLGDEEEDYEQWLLKKEQLIRTRK